MPDSLLRNLPATHILLQALFEAHTTLAASVPRPLLKQIVTAFLDDLRQQIHHKILCQKEELELETLLPHLVQYVRCAAKPHLRRVINATGVVLHTNMGRSRLCDAAITAITETGRWYSNLEFDLQSGQRGSRYSHVEDLICSLTGAEAALVVNNNAAAVLLLLDTFCKGKQVIVSRGELVEIGGSFRIPDVMEKSGCTLMEVGATNRTHLKDYAQAITQETAALLKVHTSNFRIIGFTTQVNPQDLAQLAHENGLPAFFDLGSGSLLPSTCWGGPALTSEPTVQELLAAHIDVVTLSGDKMLGGPQAGILAGKKIFLDALKTNPLTRALRIDKLSIAALEATLRLYTDPEQAVKHIPVLRMLNASAPLLRKEAEKLQKIIKKQCADFLPVSTHSKTKKKTQSISLQQGFSRVGGGAFPEYDLPTWLVCLHGFPVDPLKHTLLQQDPPLAGRIENDAFCLDVRTLDPTEYAVAAQVIAQALQQLASTKTVPAQP